MDHAFRVRFGETFRDLGGNLNGFFDRQWAGLELLLQRLALVVRHDDEQLTVGCGLNVVNRADVAMVGRRRGLRLAKKTLFRAFVVAPLRRQELERDKSPEADVAGGVDDTHSAATELCYYLVMGNCSAD